MGHIRASWYGAHWSWLVWGTLELVGMEHIRAGLYGGTLELAGICAPELVNVAHTGDDRYGHTGADRYGPHRS